MNTEFSPRKRHSQLENFPTPSGLKTGSDFTLSAGLSNRRNPTNKGVRALGVDQQLYRCEKTTPTYASNLGTKPSQGIKENHAQIFDKTVKDHALSMDPAQRASAMRLVKDRWKQGLAYLRAATTLGLAPSVLLTLNWQTLSTFSETSLVQSPVNKVTAKFIRRLSDWFRYRSLPSSFVWAVATGSFHGVHCHVAAFVPDDLLGAFLTWLARVCGDPWDHVSSDQDKAVSKTKGWLVRFVYPPQAAYAVCYVCLQPLWHLSSAHEPKRRFGRSLRAS